MMTLRRGVGSDSRKPQMPRLRSTSEIGPVEPEDGVHDRGQGRVERRRDDDPQERRLGDVGDLDRGDERR